MITSLILIYSNYYQEFILATDVSYYSFGAMLSQKANDGKEHPIAYASKSIWKKENNYAATELECAAVIWAVEYFHKYLGASHFTLITDHSALIWLKTSEPKGRTARWMMKLQPYNFTIIYKLKRIYLNIDTLL